MAAISHAAESEIKKLLVSWWTAVNQQLSVVTGASVQIGDAPIELLVASEIGQRLVRIALLLKAFWPGRIKRGPESNDAARSKNGSTGPHHPQDPEEFLGHGGYMVLCAQVWAVRPADFVERGRWQNGMSLNVLSQHFQGSNHGPPRPAGKSHARGASAYGSKPVAAARHRPQAVHGVRFD